MKKIFAFAIAAVALLAVSCNKEIAPENLATIEKTFTVTAPESSKTALNGMNIFWSEGDEINVIAKTTGNQYTFTLKSGAGTASAKFTGAIDAEDAEETEFIAVYPNVEIVPTSLSASTPVIEFKKTLGRIRNAVKDGFDPTQSVLSAVGDGESFSFRHGSAYFKIKVTQENVDSIVIQTGGTRFSGRPKYNLDGSYNNIEGAKPDVVLAPASGVLENGATYYVPVLCKNSSLKTLTIYAYNHNGKVATLSTDKKTSVKLELGKVYDLGSPNISVDPILTLTKTVINGISSDAATDLTATEAYTLRNCTDSDVTVSVDGTVVTAASVADGTVTYSVSANTGDSRDGWIGLAVEGQDVQKIVVKQNAPGIKESYAWDFSSYTDAQMEAITGLKADAKASAGQIWDFGDGLKMVTNSSSKWNNQTINEVEYKWIATGGKYGSNQKYFSFTTEHTGTVTVLYASGSDKEGSNLRSLTLNVGGTENTDSSNVSTGTTDLQTVTFSSVAAGSLKLYSKDDNVRIFSISFLED